MKQVVLVATIALLMVTLLALLALIVSSVDCSTDEIVPFPERLGSRSSPLLRPIEGLAVEPPVEMIGGSAIWASQVGAYWPTKSGP
jgi:uncharacterized protein YggT (Ycf19 family)